MTYGARISLMVGVVATVLATVAGVVVGLAAGYLGGPADLVLSRFMDMVLSFPYLLLAIALVSVFGSSLTISMLVIAFFSWAAIGRVVRGQTLSIREQEYIEAAWSVGSGALRVMFGEILPNLLAPVIVLATLLVPTAIVFEATLSFLGLGVPPPTPTWGGMLSDSLNFYQVAWWFPLFPGLALLATTLAFNLLGDGVRTVGGEALPTWNPELSLDIMDRVGIGRAVLSCPIPLHFLDSGAAASMSLQLAMASSLRIRNESLDNSGGVGDCVAIPSRGT